MSHLFSFASRVTASALQRALLALLASSSLLIGLERRASQTLTLPQELPRQGYKLVDQFPGVAFASPVTIAAPPDETNRLFIVEKGGRIAVITNLAKPDRSVFLDLTPRRLLTGGESGALGLAFHPGFATNGFFFVSYSLSNFTSSEGRGIHQRLARFQAVPPAAATVNLTTERPLITQFDQAANHNGGDLHFGPDGYLYLSLGDEGGGLDTFNNAQRIDKDFFAGILRIDVDARPENADPTPHPAFQDATHLAYKIPAGNPWVGATQFLGRAVDSAKLRAEFYAVGLRNPWKFSFDPETGTLFCGDVGQDTREEINVIVKGGNYGWAFREGSLAGPKSSQAPAGQAFLPPIHEYSHGSSGTTTGNSVTGGHVYRGSRLPDLRGYYVFGDYISGNIWALRYENQTTNGWVRLANERSISGFGLDPRNGDLLIAAYTENKIKRLDFDPSIVGTPLPQTLADTGAFSDLASLTPQAGIVGYSVNVPFWSDGAEKRRWFSLPRTNTFIQFSASNNWVVPAGAVWIKHFDLVTNEVTGTRRRLETRFLIKNSTGLYGITYRWEPGSTNATLVPKDGVEEDIPILSAGGLIRTQRWSYPSRSACLACHPVNAGGLLGFSTVQLNGDHEYPDSGPTNQLRALAQAGYFQGPIPSPASLPRLVPANHPTASLEYRVRSYLDANCAGCHQPGGSAPNTWDARFVTSTAISRIIEGSLNDQGGDEANQLVSPGDLDHSEIFTRINTRGPKQMPPLASSELDRASVELLQTWINSPEIRSRGSYQIWRSAVLSGAAEAEADPAADPDQDGGNNEQEWLAGTNPRDPADRLGVAIRSRAGAYELWVTLPANRQLTIETSESLLNASPWEPVPFDFPFPPFRSTSETVVAPLPGTDGAGRYYRVRVDTL